MNLYPIILTLMLVGGIAISLWGWVVMKRAQRKQKWPHVPGRIEVSDLSSELDDLLPHIVFSYTVEGKAYERAFEFPPDINPMPEFSKSYCDKYPVGADIQAYYDPADPGEATLEPGSRGDWMVLALGLLMILVGAVSLLWSDA